MLLGFWGFGVLGFQFFLEMTYQWMIGHIQKDSWSLYASKIMFDFWILLLVARCLAHFVGVPPYKFWYFWLTLFRTCICTLICKYGTGRGGAQCAPSPPGLGYNRVNKKNFVYVQKCDKCFKLKCFNLTSVFNWGNNSKWMW